MQKYNLTSVLQPTHPLKQFMVTAIGIVFNWIKQNMVHLKYNKEKTR